jgi:hypothetical protein
MKKCVSEANLKASPLIVGYIANELPAKRLAVGKYGY